MTIRSLGRNKGWRQDLPQFRREIVSTTAITLACICQAGIVPFIQRQQGEIQMYWSYIFDIRRGMPNYSNANCKSSTVWILRISSAAGAPNTPARQISWNANARMSFHWLRICANIPSSREARHSGVLEGASQTPLNGAPLNYPSSARQ